MMTATEMVRSIREMTTMETATPGSVQVKKSFLRDVANKLEELDERCDIMMEYEKQDTEEVKRDLLWVAKNGQPQCDRERVRKGLMLIHELEEEVERLNDQLRRAYGFVAQSAVGGDF